MAPSVKIKCPTLAQVMVSQSEFEPRVGLCADSLEPEPASESGSGSVCLSLSLSVSLSKINIKKIFLKWTVYVSVVFIRYQ